VQAIEIKFEFVGGDFAVFKTASVDARSNCPNLTMCLQSAHNTTTTYPLVVIIEANTGSTTAMSKWVWDWFDTALTAIWPRSQIITPALVLGKFDNLRDAVQARGWPGLRDSMGKVLFLLRVNASSYAADSANLRDRVGFPIHSLDALGSSDAVVFEQPNPLYRIQDMQDAAARGFLLITRSDATFVPDTSGAADPFDPATFLAAADRDSDGRASSNELRLLFDAGMADLADTASAHAALLTALDAAVFACAGADADGVAGVAQMACVLDAVRARLPQPEGLVAARARLRAARRSGAHVVLTNYPAPPFRGAPAATYFWVADDDFGVGGGGGAVACNPVTTCACYVTDFIAMSKCSGAAAGGGGLPWSWLSLVFVVVSSLSLVCSVASL
jgi:hypothetical protein